MPTTKVAVGAVAGALVTILVWVVSQWGHVEVPAPVASAATVVVSFIMSWLIPEPTSTP